MEFAVIGGFFKAFRFEGGNEFRIDSSHSFAVSVEFPTELLYGVDIVFSALFNVVEGGEHVRLLGVVFFAFERECVVVGEPVGFVGDQVGGRCAIIDLVAGRRYAAGEIDDFQYFIIVVFFDEIFD